MKKLLLVALILSAMSIGCAKQCKLEKIIIKYQAQHALTQTNIKIMQQQAELNKMKDELLSVKKVKDVRPIVEKYFQLQKAAKKVKKRK